MIRNEALWTVCNAVNSAAPADLKALYDQRGGSLIQPMTDALPGCTSDPALVVAILNALL